ncbi:MAG: YceI family protein, partial [Bdellovibrionales bacterium]|nr:YceI family protein [Bdellovibrionales bacterium]
MRQVLSLFIILFSLFSFAKTNINQQKSELHWKGKKVTGEHHGVVKLKSGYFDVKKQKAEVEVDMTTIDVLDLKGEWKDKLMNHLRSDDFFAVNKHKTAKIQINKIIAAGKGLYNVAGTLTI